MKEENIKKTEETAEATAQPTTEPNAEISELDAVKAERDEYLAGWQRSKADFANAKKRFDEDMKAFRAMANEGLIEELLPVLSSFEMAFANRDAWEKADKNWRAGVEYIYTQIKSVLEQNGLKEINPIGEKFDYTKHEAIEHESVDDVSKENTVTRVIEKGYILGGKLMRPAKVAVGDKKVA